MVKRNALRVREHTRSPLPSILYFVYKRQLTLVQHYEMLKLFKYDHYRFACFPPPAPPIHRRHSRSRPTDPYSHTQHPSQTIHHTAAAAKCPAEERFSTYGEVALAFLDCSYLRCLSGMNPRFQSAWLPLLKLAVPRARVGVGRFDFGWLDLCRG